MLIRLGCSPKNENNAQCWKEDSHFKETMKFGTYIAKILQ